MEDNNKELTAMEDTKALRELIEQQGAQIKQLQDENGRLHKVIADASREVNRLRGLLSGYNRLDVLMGVTDKATKNPKMFPAEFTSMVKLELMYLVNGYDPKGIFNVAEEEEKPEDQPTVCGGSEIPSNEDMKRAMKNMAPPVFDESVTGVATGKD